MSTQPGRGSKNQPFILGIRSPGKLKAGRWETGDESGERTWDWEFSLSLQEGRVCIDELLGLTT